MTVRAVFLDRDGVLNRADVRDGRPFAPRQLAGFDILPEAPAAIALLHDLGFRTIVVTNQRDVGKGLVDITVMEAMHAQLAAAMPLDAIKVCTCVDDCPHYKPNPGMLLEAADEFGIDLGASFMVGDRWRDIDAGRRAGCTTIFIDRGYNEPLRDAPDHTVHDVGEAAAVIARHCSIPKH